MPRIRVTNFSTYYDVKNRVQFSPVLDKRSGCFVAVAEVTDAVAQAWAESSGLLRERVTVLEETALAVLDGQLSVDELAIGDLKDHAGHTIFCVPVELHVRMGLVHRSFKRYKFVFLSA